MMHKPYSLRIKGSPYGLVMANVRGVAVLGFLDRATPVVAGGVAITMIHTGDGAR